MKKMTVFALMATVITSSCSQDEIVDTNDGNKIGVRTSVMKPNTKAANQVTNVTDFIVKANDGTKDFIPEGFSDGSTFGGESYVWPGTVLNFTALSHGTNKTTDLRSIASSTLAFTPEPEIADQKELLVAFNSTLATQVSGTVGLNFRHALSQIEVSAKNSATSHKVRIAGVKLANAKSGATITFPTTSTATENTPLDAGVWTAHAAATNYVAAQAAGANAITALTGDASRVILPSTLKNFMLVPQANDPAVFVPGTDETTTNTGKTYISVLCHITSADDTGVIFPTETKHINSTNGSAAAIVIGTKNYQWVSVAVDLDWLPGKKYTYTLDFTKGGGVVDPEIDPETPIVLGLIGVTITTDQWQTGEGDGDKPMGPV
jgi:hypothetical protein